MPRELITIQVGQCGNQIAMRFWDLALREHANNLKNDCYNEALSSFFRNVDTRGKNPIDIPCGDGKSKIASLKARAVVVDMEEGVIKEILRSELGELFDEKQFINDVSGAGNNWACGHCFYGPQYKEHILERIRKATEKCDSLQCFFITHSLGGGTGSGVGTYIIGLLEDYFPDVFRFSASVFPSRDDDVITSPYNSFLSLNELYKHADCVFPIENEALLNICKQIENPTKGKAPLPTSAKTEIKSNDITIKEGSKLNQTGKENKKEKAFDKMNNIIAHLLSNLTCSMRFEGVLNVDLNEITMNLVPYPDMHFLLSSMAPLYSLADTKFQPRKLDQMFKDCYSPDHQLICCNPLQHKYTALGLIIRGDCTFSDVNRNIKRMRDDLDMIYWNREGFKYGICNTPPIGQPYSLLCLANNTCIKETFSEMIERFNKLYRRKAHVHHYTEYLPIDHFEEALNNIRGLIKSYEDLEKLEQPSSIPRLKPVI